MKKKQNTQLGVGWVGGFWNGGRIRRVPKQTLPSSLTESLSPWRQLLWQHRTNVFTGWSQLPKMPRDFRSQKGLEDKQNRKAEGRKVSDSICSLLQKIIIHHEKLMTTWKSFSQCRFSSTISWWVLKSSLPPSLVSWVAVGRFFRYSSIYKHWSINPETSLGPKCRFRTHREWVILHAH